MSVEKRDTNINTYNYTCHMQATSLNVRSLIEAKKREKVSNFITLTKPEIVFLQETWH